MRPLDRRVILAFLVLFLSYQIPEGVGLRLLGSEAAFIALMLGFHGLAWLVGRALGTRGFDAYELRREPGVVRNLGVTLCLAIGMKLLALLVGRALGVYDLAPPSQTFSFPQSWMMLAAFVVASYFPSAAEDLVTRGFWHRVLRPTLSPARFVVFSSLVYVLNHVYRLANGPMEWFMLFCFGLAYAAALARTGSLWAAIGLHWGWNIMGHCLPLFVTVDVRDEWAAPLLSAGAHLTMLGVMIAAPRLLVRSPAHRRG
jgi:membrane protease YdiL (CAAX protease family)